MYIKFQTSALVRIKTLKPYTLAGFEPTTHCSAGGRDALNATLPEQINKKTFFLKKF
jgi:hypothetical protein